MGKAITPRSACPLSFLHVLPFLDELQDSCFDLRGKLTDDGNIANDGDTQRFAGQLSKMNTRCMAVRFCRQLIVFET